MRDKSSYAFPLLMAASAKAIAGRAINASVMVFFVIFIGCRICVCGLGGNFAR